MSELLIRRKCERCQEEFVPHNAKQRFCSRFCQRRVYDAARRQEHKPIKCAFCGKEFTPRANNSRFCSKSCRNRFSQNSVMGTVVCAECGKTFQSSYTHAKFCSKACWYQSLKKTKPTKNCRICGVELNAETKALRFRGLNGTICDACRAKKKEADPQIVCVICGKTFTSTLWRKTCSRECWYKLKSVGKAKPASEEKQQMATQPEPPSDTFPMTDGDEMVYGNMIYL